jgi:glycosyltransferase involved in cell wall biosynthesis
MLLSIIIPSYNHARFVVKTMRAAARIDINDKEVIVIDDGSSDASPSVIGEYIEREGKDHNIRLITRENRGLVRTLNEGLALARGKYFYVVASDDIPIPEGIRSLIYCLDHNADLQFALGNALYMTSESQCEFTPTYGEAHQRFFALSYDNRQKEMFLNYPHPILLQATVFKTTTLKNIGGWREDIISDDLSLFLRLFSQIEDVGKNFTFRPDVMTCFYRRHEVNISRDLERQFKTIDQVITQLCPDKWQDAAYLKTFVGSILMAVKGRNLFLGVRFFRSTVAHVGLYRWLLGTGPALINYMRVTRRLRNKFDVVVAHDPATTEMSPRSDRKDNTVVLGSG